MRILIAEDEKVAQKVLQRFFFRLGHEVFVAENGKKAFEIFKQERPDITVTDWMMPEMDGIELCQEIRKMQLVPYPFVIMVTSSDVKSHLQMGYDAGVDDFLQKPVNKLELKIKIRACERVIDLQQREQVLHNQLAMTLKISENKNSYLEAMMQELKSAQKSLEEALEAAKESTREKSAFLANMSHELRTPLNAIIGFSEMLQEDAEEDGLDEIVMDLNKIHSSGKHLLMLINDILDISKIEANKMELHIEEFLTKDLISEIVNLFKPIFLQNENQLIVECAENILPMMSDITRIRQVIYNLLSNANKFTKNGEIRLIVENQQVLDRDWIFIYVKDAGIGMSKEQMKKIFNAFSQADSSTTRRFGGTGLGLTISKRLCQLMGGDICVKSQLDAGSMFTVALPITINKQENIQSEFEFNLMFQGMRAHL
ncbi:MAG: response regulator [Methylococcales bacterium]|jgi:signal transduction histidine kinase|nr:response regulator [Methylococcales bacterium]MBT7411284.1 response regulator [Methylococcales bacterium]